MPSFDVVPFHSRGAASARDFVQDLFPRVKDFSQIDRLSFTCPTRSISEAQRQATLITQNKSGAVDPSQTGLVVSGDFLT